MLRFKKYCILHPLLLLLNFLLTASIQQNASISIQMTICKSQKPYNKCEAVNISHSSCSSSLNYVFLNLSAGLSSQSNSLLLYNCSDSKLPSSPYFRTLTCIQTHGASSEIEKLEGVSSASCVLVDDLTKLDMGFDPSDLKCSCYGRVHQRSSHEISEEHDMGTRIALEVPDHIPNICNECEKTNGDCGAALRCICHPKECKNKVISETRSTASNSFGNNIIGLLLPLLLVIVMTNY